MRDLLPDFCHLKMDLNSCDTSLTSWYRINAMLYAFKTYFCQAKWHGYSCINVALHIIGEQVSFVFFSLPSCLPQALRKFSLQP